MIKYRFDGVYEYIEAINLLGQYGFVWKTSDATKVGMQYGTINNEVKSEAVLIVDYEMKEVSRSIITGFSKKGIEDLKKDVQLYEKTVAKGKEIAKKLNFKHFFGQDWKDDELEELRNSLFNSRLFLHTLALKGVDEAIKVWSRENKLEHYKVVDYQPKEETKRRGD